MLHWFALHAVTLALPVAWVVFLARVCVRSTR